VEKPEETVVIRKEKVAKRKENRPAGKVENAMKLRFPLSHRACHQKQRNDRGAEPKSTWKAAYRPPSSTRRTWSVRRCYKPATDPAVSSCRHPAVLVDARQSIAGLMRSIAGLMRLIAGLMRLIAGLMRSIAGLMRLIAGLMRLIAGLMRLIAGLSRLIAG
jgi:hypothetical protein